MPLYRAGTFFPAKIGSQRQTLEEKLTEAGQEFRQGLEEENEDLEAIRNLGNMFEASKQKAENMFGLSSAASVKEILEHD